MADLGDYPVDYILSEIRGRVHADTADEVERVYSQDRERILQDAWDEYQGSEPEEEVSRSSFEQAMERTFDALLGTRHEELRDKRARSGLATAGDTPSLRELTTWSPKEKVTGYLYQIEVVVDLSDPADPSEEPLTVNTFYSIKSPHLLTHGEVLASALADFESETSDEGSFPGQPILGAIITGVYHFDNSD